MAAALATAAAAALLPAARRPQPPQRLADRVILLGFDGAAPNLIGPLLAQGRLPALARLMEEGAYGPLRSFSPTKSAILWTSVATGKTMLKHGIVDWTYVNKMGIQVPYEDRSRRVKTYWEILAERGVTTGTINWWMSYPPPPILSGYIVSNAFRHTAELGTVHPRRLFASLEPLRMDPDGARAEMERLGIPDWRRLPATVPVRGGREVLDAYPVYVAHDATVERVSDFLYARQPVEVFSTYFRLVDVTSHFAVRFVDRALYDAAVAEEEAGRLTPATVARLDADFARVVAPVYEQMDRIVARYLARLDDRTLLIVCSDHGFAFFKGAYAHAHLSMEPPDGVLFLAGAGVKRGARLHGATLFDVAPTLLHAVGQPVAADMDGTVLRGAFDESALDRGPVRTVASYESGGRRTGEGDGNPNLGAKVLEDLQTLGYIQAGGSGARAPGTPAAPRRPAGPDAEIEEEAAPPRP